jgi:4-amino-4-deoxy-L-arabinose transferase-like glycosyltransferase
MARLWWIPGIALLLLAWFGPLGSYALFNPDEGRYGEIPREMVASGDWVTPRLDAIKYFEKPPLQYWATAVAFESFGEHEWTTRLWGALTGAAGIALTFWLGRRLWGRRAGELAAAVQTGSLLYASIGHLATLDMSLTFALQLTLGGLVMLVHEPSDTTARRGGVGLLGLGVSAAFLTKGLIALLIPGSVAVLYMLLARDWALLWRARPWWVLAALALLAGPWLYAVSLRNPEFLHFFFIRQQFQRFLTTVDDRYEGVWFFVPILLLGFLPWTTLLPRVLKEAWRDWRGGAGVSLLLLLWLAFVFVFFSLSKSQLIPYLLPLVPALALLAGRTVSRIPAAALGRHLWAGCLLWLAIGGAALVLPHPSGLATRLEIGAGPAVPGMAAAFLGGGLLCGVGAWLARRARTVCAVWSAALGTLVLVGGSLIFAQQLPRMARINTLIDQVRPELHAATRLYCVNDYEQSIPFYLGRTCTLVGYRGELDFGLQQEPALWLADLSQFAQSWALEPDAVAFLTPAAFRKLAVLGTPMRLIYTAPSIVAVAKQ